MLPPGPPTDARTSVPPPERRLPRETWQLGEFVLPPLPDSRVYDESRIHWAARYASIEWSEKTAAGESIDPTCFNLAVLDKVIEHLNYDRDQRVYGSRPTFASFFDWSTWTNNVIRCWYWTAYRQLPNQSNLPSFDETYFALRAAVTTLFRRVTDARMAPAGNPPRYDRALLGRFDPNCRPAPPVVRYVQRLRFRDSEEPSEEQIQRLEEASSARRGRRRFNVVRTVELPPLDVDMSVYELGNDNVAPNT